MPPPSPRGVLESCLYAEDLDAAETFYGKRLGLELISRNADRHVFFRCGRQMVLIFNPAVTEIPAPPDADLAVPAHGARGPGHLCFEVEEIELAAWERHLNDNGVATDAIVDWPNGTRSLYVRDPAGNSIEFADRKLWFGDT